MKHVPPKHFGTALKVISAAAALLYPPRRILCDELLAPGDQRVGQHRRGDGAVAALSRHLQGGLPHQHGGKVLPGVRERHLLQHPTAGVGHQRQIIGLLPDRVSPLGAEVGLHRAAHRLGPGAELLPQLRVENQIFRHRIAPAHPNSTQAV